MHVLFSCIMNIFSFKSFKSKAASSTIKINPKVPKVGNKEEGRIISESKTKKQVLIKIPKPINIKTDEIPDFFDRISKK